MMRRASCTTVVRSLLAIALTGFLHGRTWAQAELQSPQAIQERLSALSSRAIDIGLSSYFFVGPQCGLLFVGTRHAFDPTTPLFPVLNEQFQTFRPDELIVEGGQWPPMLNREQTIRHQGEMGYLTSLGRQAGLTTSSFEPNQLELVARAAQTHTVEQVKLYMTLRMVPQWRATFGIQALPEHAQSFLAHEPPIDAGPHTPEELDFLVRQGYGSAADWRQIDEHLRIGGTRDATVLAVDTTVNGIRNDALLQAIETTLRKKRRVMVAAGTTHLAALIGRLNGLDALCRR